MTLESAKANVFGASAATTGLVVATNGMVLNNHHAFTFSNSPFFDHHSGILASTSYGGILL
jgi:hypothetical protein